MNKLNRAFGYALLVFLLAPGITHAQGCTAILTSDNQADFAVAGALGEKLSQGVIVTPWGTLSDESIEQVASTRCTAAYVIGGDAAVPGAESALAGRSIAVERLGGDDRYGTSARVAGLWESSTYVFIAAGHDPVGIAEAAEKAKAQKAPVVFTRPDRVPETVSSAITGLKISQATIITSPDMDATGIDEGIRAAGVSNVEKTESDSSARAQSAIEQAQAELTRAEESASELTDANSIAAFRLAEQAREHLNYAQVAFNGDNYGEAFGRATAAREDAEGSLKISSGIVAGYLERKVGEAREEIEALAKKRRVDIGDIVADPVRYGGKEVRVTGSVPSDPAYIGEKTYIELIDATGRIFIEFEGFMGPPLVKGGDTVEVTGTVRVNPEFGGSHGASHTGMPSYIIEAEEIERIS